MESHLKLRLKSFIELGEPCQHPKMPVFGVALKMWGDVIFLFWQPQNLKHDLILIAFLKIILMIYIYFACRSVSWYIYTLLVGLFHDIYIYFACRSVSLYPINVKTAEPIGPKFCVWPHMTPVKFCGCSESQKIVSKYISKFPKKLLSHQRTFYFCFIQRERCSQKELQLK